MSDDIDLRPAPVGLQLKRTHGFSIHKVSHDANQRGVLNVARPGQWGNPYRIEDTATKTAEEAVALFRACLDRWAVQEPDKLEEYIAPLRGRNLACWCPIGTPCHREVLLEFARRPPPVLCPHCKKSPITHHFCLAQPHPAVRERDAIQRKAKELATALEHLIQAMKAAMEAAQRPGLPHLPTRPMSAPSLTGKTGHPEINILGQTFGFLTVEKEIAPSANTRSTADFWRCRCVCGKTRDVRGATLRAGDARSCGCKHSRAVASTRPPPEIKLTITQAPLESSIATAKAMRKIVTPWKEIAEFLALGLKDGCTIDQAKFWVWGCVPNPRPFTIWIHPDYARKA